MKTFRLIAVAFIFTAAFAASAFAQTAAQSGSNFKLAVINTSGFDSKDGITKYVNAMNTLEGEFKPDQTAIETMLTKYQSLGKEIETLRTQAQGGKVPIDQKSAEAKAEEYKNMEISIKRKQEDAKQKFERRQQQLMGPILQDIGKAMQEFAKQKGYSMILDAGKLESAGLLLAFDDAAKIDVTKEFITFYNARPAGAATAKP